MGLRTAAFNAYVCYSDMVEVRHPPQPRPLRPYFLLFLLVANILAVEGQQQVFNISRPSGTGILEYFPLEGENKDDGGGVCLDGSPAGYYYRPGQGPGANKFLLYYEGGGWCTSGRSSVRVEICRPSTSAVRFLAAPDYELFLTDLFPYPCP